MGAKFVWDNVLPVLQPDAISQIMNDWFIKQSKDALAKGLRKEYSLEFRPCEMEKIKQ